MHGPVETALHAKVIARGANVVGDTRDGDLFRTAGTGSVGAKIEAQAPNAGSGQTRGEPRKETALLTCHTSTMGQYRQPFNNPRGGRHRAFQRGAIERSERRLQISHSHSPEGSETTVTAQDSPQRRNGKHAALMAGLEALALADLGQHEREVA